MKLPKVLLMLGLLSVSGASLADTSVLDLKKSAFPYTTGKDIFHNVCAACHMQDAKGATGAGFIPALASNPRLVNPNYMEFVIMNGQKGMPPFSQYLTNEQMAETINYVRSHFGNTYPDKVKPEDLEKFRATAVATE